ncbi:hypothetical protein QR680_005248 [Steinernema hermaphroditum]|uniref:Uncharacterized protein n=1 Tax=Steinernema hermaphroditum TaxID=289476 RepID=A0AA39HSD6_9BILA|nr:hypothetical protein QR680_005248 [Steinernema hermaphroditum]
MALRDAEKEMQLRAHLRDIDDRLEQAIRSRNEYVEYLKSKYPNLSSNRFETAKEEGREERKFANWNSRGVQRIVTRDPTNPDPYAQSMLILTPQEARPPSRLRDDLKTNIYHWDIGRTAPSQRYVAPPGPLPRISDPIPSNGVLLQSDLPRIRARLAEIKSDLADLRDQRMFMSSADYHRTILPSREPFLGALNAFQAMNPQNAQNHYGYAIPNAIPPTRSDRSFAEILNKLTEITEEAPEEEAPPLAPQKPLVADSHRDVHIDRMFEKMREQVAEDTVERGRAPLSPPRRVETAPREAEDPVVVRRTIQFEAPKPSSPQAPATKPSTPSYGQILASMEQTRKMESSDSDSDDDVPPKADKSKVTPAAASVPAQDDFLARFLSADKRSAPGKTAPPIDLDDDDFY